MSWRREDFRLHYRAAIGTVASSNSYVSYLNLVDELVLGLDARLTQLGSDGVLQCLQSQPDQCFSRARSRRNCESALRAYASFSAASGIGANPAPIISSPEPKSDDEVGAVDRAVSLDKSTTAEIKEILLEAKRLAARYYRATGKPLGVTGEVAELEAAERLDLQLLEARSPGYDALRGPSFRIQIKGRAVSRVDRYRGRCPSIKGDNFDSVVLVLLDRTSYDALEIWEAPRDAVLARIAAPGGRARTERRSLAITQFRSVAMRVWPPSSA